MQQTRQIFLRNIHFWKSWNNVDVTRIISLPFWGTKTEISPSRFCVTMLQYFNQSGCSPQRLLGYLNQKSSYIAWLSDGECWVSKLEKVVRGRICNEIFHTTVSYVWSTVVWKEMARPHHLWLNETLLRFYCRCQAAFSGEAQRNQWQMKHFHWLPCHI